jgi:hypothetical protein
MSKMLRLLLAFALATGILAAYWVITPTSPQVLAQSATIGEWKASVQKESSKIHLSLERRTERGGHNQMGQTYEITDFQGLSREAVLNGGAVRF